MYFKKNGLDIRCWLVIYGEWHWSSPGTEPFTSHVFFDLDKNWRDQINAFTIYACDFHPRRSKIICMESRWNFFLMIRWRKNYSLKYRQSNLRSFCCKEWPLINNVGIIFFSKFISINSVIFVLDKFHFSWNWEIFQGPVTN